MDATNAILLPVAFFVAALLYSSVGHAGASAYLAVMALASIEPAVMKPTALTLNILVAAVASYNFRQAGHFSWRLFWPFAVTSIPCAYLGGAMTAPPTAYKYVVGAVLLFAAFRMFAKPTEMHLRDLRPPRALIAFPLGAIIGFLSGLTGVGGGIFLSPLLVMAGWASIRTASGVAALFIFVNSSAGLLGMGNSLSRVPPEILFWQPVALLGGFLGSYWGSRRLPVVALRRLLAVVLIIAGAKMILTGSQSKPVAVSPTRAMISGQTNLFGGTP
ncbi:Sulfite exporter TauE/SafE [Phycisphaerae bacterium RAS2]|nr:Sulfite exporter TauE/SafE [Phycisphaerae bacterium RAS2]